MDEKFIIGPGFEKIRLTHSLNQMAWVDADGDFYAYSEDLGFDPYKRCGIRPFALPLIPFFAKINADCAPHDEEYTNEFYIAYHTEDEADTGLRDRLKVSGYPIISQIFYSIVRVFGPLVSRLRGLQWNKGWNQSSLQQQSSSDDVEPQ